MDDGRSLVQYWTGHKNFLFSSVQTSVGAQYVQQLMDKGVVCPVVKWSGLAVHSSLYYGVYLFTSILPHAFMKFTGTL
jgi:hypothetical protein